MKRRKSRLVFPLNRAGYLLLGIWCTVLSAQSNDEVPSTSNPTRNDTDELDRVIMRQAVTSNTDLSPWSPLRQTILDGHIGQLDAGGLTIETVAGQVGEPSLPTRIPGSQLLAVIPAWKGTGTAELVQLFQQSRYAEFIQALRDQDRNEIPRWQQLLLLEMVVRAVTDVQGPAGSGQYFLTLAESAPEILYAEMPLCWAVCEPSAELVRKSRDWLDADNDVAQLLGASWLLHGPESQKARNAIVRLCQSSNFAVAQLASAQSWRMISPPETMKILPRWLAFRDRMLPPLALGPTEFLADRLSRIGESDLAVGQWLWIATTVPERHNKASRALRNAETLLLSNGHNDEAARIAGWIKNLHGISE